MSEIFDDLFGEFMGGRRTRGRSAKERGSDLKYNMEITLAEAFCGKAAQIRVPASVTCEACGGAGAEAGSSPITCPTCQGFGKVRASQGFFTIERTCMTCQGRGEIIQKPCHACSGSGRVTRERVLSVNIPAGRRGFDANSPCRRGRGGVRGGPAGDLYIFLIILPDDIFQRDGADLFCRVPITMTTAALGGQIEVPTIDGGRARVKVPEGTETGKQFRLRGKGMPVLRSKLTGDLYVQVEVETPQNLSRKQKDLLKEFEKVSTELDASRNCRFSTARSKPFGIAWARIDTNFVPAPAKTPSLCLSPQGERARRFCTQRRTASLLPSGGRTA